MRTRSAIRLGERDFAQQVYASPFSVVRVGSGYGIRFSEELIDHFDRLYPRQFFFGTLDQNRIQSPDWWTQHFRTAYGPLARGARNPPEGYYLFQRGAVLAHIEPPLHVHPLARAQQVIRYLEDHVKRRLRAERSDTEQWTWEERAPGAPDPEPEAPPPAPPPTPATPAPFAVLGVTPEATDAELRKAYKEQMKLNHPDRVAHLSPAIQEVAAKQTLAIQAAWEVVKRMRGL